MKICKKDAAIYFKGLNLEIKQGATYQDDSEIVLANASLFEDVKVQKAPVAPVAPVAKVELKEELLAEAPVAELEVEIKDEELQEEEQEEETK